MQLIPMTSKFYLPRKLQNHEKEYNELEVIGTFKIIIILAEPGAGKTSLLDSFSNYLNVTKKTANVFSNRNNFEKNSPLIIDALDELVRVDQSAIGNLLGKAADLEPSILIISSRSSEWEDSYTRLVKDNFGVEPQIFRIFPFDEEEQKQIFQNYKPNEDFVLFKSEVQKYNLEALLANPQFLKIFGDAYIESNKKFEGRKYIFSQAVKALAKETNSAYNFRNDLPTLRKIELIEEIFAKLLLAGAEGVSTNSNEKDILYPRIDSLIRLENTDQYNSLLSCGLFKMADNESQHQPNHKIVAEFGAANYLVKRINAHQNSISLNQCLSIIAPNNIVRDELRGLVGWMASLGNQVIQEALIEIDPYAVLANGDPSQLIPSSKKYLLEKLSVVAEEDPYFRRNDKWRIFSVEGFFDHTSVENIKRILSYGNDKSVLKDLILELLENSTILNQLILDFERIVIDESVAKHTRQLAGLRLAEVGSEQGIAPVLEKLIEINTDVSLKISSSIIEEIGIEQVQYELILNLLKQCKSLYPDDYQHPKYSTSINRYFIRRFISLLNYSITINLLDALSEELDCTCKKEDYKCYCKEGKSKIVGLLLDNYFKLEKREYEPKRIWKWINNLRFHTGKNEQDSIAVKVLQQEDKLRQDIIKLFLNDIISNDKANEISWGFFNFNIHSGLYLKQIDYYFIVDYFIEINSLTLWENFVPTHYFYNKEKNEINSNLRAYVRKIVKDHPSFLKIWIMKNKKANKLYNDTKFKARRRRYKTIKKDEELIRKKNIEYIQNNRKSIEAGNDWSCLVRFAKSILNEPSKIVYEFGDENIVKNAIKNCIPKLDSYIPTLQELAEAQCCSDYYKCEEVLYAACLQIFREKRHLNDVETKYLQVLRTGLSMRYQAISEEEHNALTDEVDRILFADSNTRLKFLENYIEPQVALAECKNAQVSWLNFNEIFHEFRSTLPLKWLNNYSNISKEVASELFDLSLKFGSLDELKELISLRCSELYKLLTLNTEDEEAIKPKVIFWFIRGFFFLEDSVAAPYWDYLKKLDQTIFLINDKTSGFNFGNSYIWLQLSSTKIWWILDSFIERWPKVNLPSSWGNMDPPGEIAYRFLTNIIWSFEKEVSDNSLLLVNRIIEDSRFNNMHLDFKSIRSTLIRRLSLLNYKAPAPEVIVNFLDNNQIATVENLRALIIDELKLFQDDLNGSETTSKNIFYNLQFKGNVKVGYKRLGEVEATLRVADRLRLKLASHSIVVTPEHQLQNSNRCDITFSKVIDNQRRLLVLESKGQWHPELYEAASKQLFQKYSIHPEAEQQGIYFILWFGPDEKVANLTNHGINSAQELKNILESKLPIALKGLIDIFVLDVSLLN